MANIKRQILLLAATAVFWLGSQVQAKELCAGGEVIWSPTQIGCIFAQLGDAEKAMCRGAVIISPSAAGSCYVCVTSPYDTAVSNGNWTGLAVGVNRSGSRSANFSCLWQPGYEKLRDIEPCADLSDMVGWWGFDELSGQVVGDSSGANHGTRRGGARVVPGWVRQGALDLDGADDHVEIPHAADGSLDFGTGDFSIDAWVRTTQSSGVRVVLDKRQSSPYRGYHLYLYRGAPGLQLADGGYTNYNAFANPAAFVADGQWHLVAVTVDRDDPQGIRFYVDGKLVGTFNPTDRQGSLSNPAPLRLGTRSFELSGFWQGTLDELELFDRVLSPEEIAELWAVSVGGKCGR